jgi:hypothetical protein
MTETRGIVQKKSIKKSILFLSIFLLVISIIPVFISQKVYGSTSPIFQDSFESNDFSNWTLQGNSIITTDNPQDGNYCMRTLGGDNGNNSNNGYADKNFGVHYTTLYALEYVKIREYPHDEETNTNNFLFLANIDNYGLVAAVGLYTYNGNAKWSLAYANGGWGHSVQTDAFMNPALNEWYALELRVTCGLGSAEYQVWLNGIELMDFHITGANSIISTIDYLEIGDSLFMQDYDNVTVSEQYIVPTVSTPITQAKTAVVARGTDNSIWYRVYDSSNWNDWTNLIGSTAIEPAAAIYQGNLYIAAIDGSTHIWLSTIDLNTQTWSGWNMWPNTYAASITFAASADRLAIVARGLDGSIWYRVFDGSNWNDWTHIVASTSIEPAVAIFQGNLYIAAIDGSTHIWISTVNLNTQVWSGWSMWQGTYASSVTFASSEDYLAIIARGVDNSIWYRVYDDSNWNDWTNLIGSTAIEPAAAIYQGNLYIAAIDGSTHIWLSTIDLNTQTWSGWNMWPNTYAASVTLTAWET